MLRLLHIMQYLAVVIEGDGWLNDWLTHMDHETAARMEVIGRALAQLIK